MPRNGSGTYNLPGGNPVVSGSLIQASWANSTLTDLAAAMTNSLSSDGQTTPTANLPMGGFRFTNVGAATAAAHVALASQVQSGSFNVAGTVAGGPTAYTCTLPLATVVFTVGQTIIFTPNVNCDDTPTLSVNGTPAKFITDAAGTSLLADMLVAGSTYTLIWDGLNWRTGSGSGLYLPITGGELNGSLGINMAPGAYALDVSGPMRVQSTGTNLIIGDTANPSLEIQNVGIGIALYCDGDVDVDGLINSDSLTTGDATASMLTVTSVALLSYVASQPRIFADLSNATHANRLLFQTAGAGSGSTVGVIPPAAGTSAALNAYSGSDPDNAAYAQVRIGSDTGDFRITAGKLGTGTYYPITFYANAGEVGRWETDGTFKAHKGVYTSRSSSGLAFGLNRYATWIDTNANTGQQGWAWLTNKSGGSDSLYLAALDDSGAVTNSIFSIEKQAAGFTRYFNLNAGILFRSSSGAPVNATFHWLNDVEVFSLDAQNVVSARGVVGDVIAFDSVVAQSTSTTTHTIDFTVSNYYKLTMGHNIATLTLTAPIAPCVVQLELVQDGGGSKTMVWPASLKWPNTYTTADKTISTAASARDLLILRWNGTDYVANLMKGIA